MKKVLWKGFTEADQDEPTHYAIGDDDGVNGVAIAEKVCYLEDVIGIDELFSQREEGIKEMIKKAEKQP
jgi:hypothetical protein